VVPSGADGRAARCAETLASDYKRSQSSPLMAGQKRPSTPARGARDHAVSVLNASGFLFQLRVEEELKAGSTRHAWAVAAREHPWYHEKTEHSGFADMILADGGRGRLVVECKRSRDAHWYFIVPAEGQAIIRRTPLYWVDDVRIEQSYKGTRIGWGSVQVLPQTFESCFCIVRGSGENDQPVLERIGSSLLDCVEAVAREEVLHQRGTGAINQLVYAPLIVTTATLHVVHCDLPSVSLTTGDIDTAKTTEVPYLRFRKALSHRFAWPTRVATLREIAESRQRTLFVVNAASLTDFLSKYQEARGAEEFPWEFASRAGAPFSDNLWP